MARCRGLMGPLAVRVGEEKGVGGIEGALVEAWVGEVGMLMLMLERMGDVGSGSLARGWFDDLASFALGCCVGGGLSKVTTEPVLGSLMTWEGYR